MNLTPVLSEKPARGNNSLRLLCVIFLSLALAITLGTVTAGCGRSGAPHANHSASAQQKYHCPMHPTYVSDRLGDCPICNMKLVPIKDDAPAAKPAAPTTDDKTAHIKLGQYYCPMDLHVISNTPGICPECEMDLVRKTEDSEVHEAHADSTPAASVPGRVSIRIAPEKRQLIGLTLSKVEKRNLNRTLRTAALVEHDETRYAKIAPRFAGWVRKLHVSFTGAPVEKGQPLFTVYSPELFSTENEYLIALRGLRQLKEEAPASQKDAAKALLESARLRLALFEIDDEEIRGLEQRDKASAELLIRAPFSGHVLTKNVVDGKAFAAGEALFEIADLSHLWLRAYIYESELPFIRQGQDAVIAFPFLNNESYPAKITFIYPHIQPQTRRAEIRLELDNPQQRLRPDMWANVELEVQVGEKLSAPPSALIDTGLRYIAFVEGPDAHLEPREVKIGARTDDFYEVVSGLNEGEQVVTRALFLVDSESQLKAAIASMISPEAHPH
ncbi:MAG TPA: efflux RND transporter periplasmic adaptor subunit [Candidatus Paceibacterota bacterium]|nr:efflux RND transporter periplasmic adaptor subunit [Verrucomicrobiota bacterium]HRY51288.1 efflux RND transporter periplasmic adaptor subunit [Candidatus Paceibacterota bacterium]HSA01212.1 efflux RND transporter periplasmic adaptor subunit [Candidatus Paceibacterota bacterium]